MEQANVFRLEEKRYKCRADTIPDMSEVLDPNDPQSFGFEALVEIKPRVFSFQKAPGLLILKNYVSSELQMQLLKSIMFTQIQDPENKTNLSPFYQLPLGNDSIWRRYYNGDGESIIDGLGETKPLTVDRLVHKKLRWVTLGEQYDWTTKEYPDPSKSPGFPKDLGDFVEKVVKESTDFLHWKAEAAIVNFYSPGDTLSAHIDESEEDLTLPLISLSMGLDCIYLIGTESRSEKPSALRLHSGDVVIMTGTSRKAFHAVPKIIPNSTPNYLLTGNKAWDGWISRKRVNFNVRQVRPSR
ncbi:Alpha-ketoglutarate-dependent dioxygenase abh1 [Schizosaccharomyces pombe]|uniref:tRNA demethylase abh1 n=1 Tax=Schizosaccharomyces pombe (strain 972 / ATCC 24843) TaxID=284812 RepID=ALKB1_SCHPO|nr:alkB homolog [Schizosaccharomyces pombe]